jgi:hypothetical protein
MEPPNFKLPYRPVSAEALAEIAIADTAPNTQAA